MRIITHPRVTHNPLTGAVAWEFVSSWLAADPVWIPPATESTARVLASWTATTEVTANLVPDAQLAALAVEHGLVVHTNDTDFARFPDVRWVNPLS
jgi:predicted nucleic acid-binding protein